MCNPLQSSSESSEILLVEDNPGDVRLLREAIETVESETTLRTAATGEDALDTLTQQATTDPVSLPDLVFLDLNLPGMDGCEVLETIRDHPQLRFLPVIMLTSSDASEDVTRCYDARANAYLTKRTDVDELVSVMETIEQFWFQTARLPPSSR